MDICIIKWPELDGLYFRLIQSCKISIERCLIATGQLPPRKAAYLSMIKTKKIILTQVAKQQTSGFACAFLYAFIYTVLWPLITHIDQYCHHHNQDRKVFHQHRGTPLGHPSIVKCWTLSTDPLSNSATLDGFDFNKKTKHTNGKVILLKRHSIMKFPFTLRQRKPIGDIKNMRVGDKKTFLYVFAIPTPVPVTEFPSSTCLHWLSQQTGQGCKVDEAWIVKDEKSDWHRGSLG